MPAPKNNALDTTNLRRNFLWNFLGSTCYAFVSLFYLMITTRFNGVDAAGIFSFAFSTANIFLVIGLYSGRTFQVTDKNHATTDSDYFYLKAFTCAAMLIVGLIFCFARGYDFEKSVIIMSLVIFRVFEAISECTYSVIQKHDRLFQVGRSMFAKALIGLIGFFLIDLFTHDLILACAIIALANLLIMFFYDFPKLFQTGFRFQNFRADRVWLLLKIGFFTFGFTFLNLYLINAARFPLDSTSLNHSAQAIYSIILMPATVLVLVSQYLIQPFLTSLKKLFATDAHKFQILILQLCAALIVIGAICLLCAWLLGIPVLELLYAIELSGHLPGLMLILLGGIFNALVVIISTALITMRRTSDQFWIYLLTAIFALFVSQILVVQSGVFGACLSYMLSMLLLLMLYILVFAYRLHKLEHNHAAEVQRATRE